MYQKPTIVNKKKSFSIMDRFISETDFVCCDYHYVLMEEGKLQERIWYTHSIRNNISIPKKSGLFFRNNELKPAPRRIKTFESDDI